MGRPNSHLTHFAGQAKEVPLKSVVFGAEIDYWRVQRSSRTGLLPLYELSGPDLYLSVASFGSEPGRSNIGLHQTVVIQWCLLEDALQGYENVNISRRLDINIEILAFPNK